jgi:hypothetical protein
MTLIDGNKSRLDDLESPLVPLTNPMPCTPTAQFKVQAVPGVSLFVLSLFIPLEPTLNVAYTLPVNHRFVDQTHLCKKNGHEFSIAEGIYKNATCKF